MQFLRIEPGVFTMGNLQPAELVCRSYGDLAVKLRFEYPPHRVRISKRFSMSRFPVTLGEYRQFARDRQERHGEGAWIWDGRDWVKKNDGDYLNPYFPQQENHPVVCVSWHDANRFCRWLSAQEGKTCRLPTEAEWEYACRAGSESAYCFGDSEEDLPAHAWYWHNSRGQTHPVGLKEPNAWGLCDMHGNVLEWCGDWHAAYPDEELTDPQGPREGLLKVARGGSWLVYGHNLRSSDRCALLPSVRHADLGFRIVLED